MLSLLNTSENSNQNLISKVTLIGKNIYEGSLTQTIRSKASDIIRNADEFDFFGEMSEIYNYVIENFRYTRDPYIAELILSAENILNNREGDCDDFVVILGALLTSVGIPIRLVLLSQNYDNDFQHIYLQAKIQDKWIDMDAAEKLPIGESIPGQKRFFEIRGTNMNTLSSLGYVSRKNRLAGFFDYDNVYDGPEISADDFNTSWLDTVASYTTKLTDLAGDVFDVYGQVQSAGNQLKVNVQKVITPSGSTVSLPSYMAPSSTQSATAAGSSDKTLLYVGLGVLASLLIIKLSKSK